MAANTPTPPEVWTTQSFHFTEDELRIHQGGEFGVPQHMVPAIADAVLDTLARLDINPHDVLLYGHPGGESLDDVIAVATRNYVDESTYAVDNAISVHPGESDPDIEVDQVDEVDEAVGLERINRENEILSRLEDEPETPLYRFSTVFDLYSDESTRGNPIHCAGITETSTINAYDRLMLESRGLEGPDSTLLHTTEAELATAAVAYIRMNYHIEGLEYGGPDAPVPLAS